VMGIPLKPLRSLISSTSSTVWSGESTTGSVMKPFSWRLTRRTIAAWDAALWLWWMTPMPPCSWG
jgi:hypothetical protein